MEDWIRTIEISMGLELFIGALLIMIVNRRYRNNRISKRTFHIQNLGILLLFIVIIGIELLTLKLNFLRNRFILIVIELVCVFIFLFIDRKFNKNESFTGGV